jgi:hypothetical protein
MHYSWVNQNQPGHRRSAGGAEGSQRRFGSDNSDFVGSKPPTSAYNRHAWVGPGCGSRPPSRARVGAGSVSVHDQPAVRRNVYRPPWHDLRRLPGARQRILALLTSLPEGAPLERFLPTVDAEDDIRSHPWSAPAIRLVEHPTGRPGAGAGGGCHLHPGGRIHADPSGRPMRKMKTFRQPVAALA